MPPCPKPVIFDTDPGIDDAMALALLARRPEISLRAITTTFGNLDIASTTRNARLLHARLGLCAPIAQGAHKPLATPFNGGVPWVHGADALGNTTSAYTDLPLPPLDPRPAHQLIIDLARAHPGQLTIIAVGPLTNLARALQEAPDIANLIAGLSIMGGAFGTNGHRGNVSPVAEANFASDPHAADIVATAAWPVTFIGLDVTQELVMTEAYLRDLQEKGGADGQLIWDVSRFYQSFTQNTRDIQGVFAHDSLAALHAVRPDLFKTRPGPVRVVTEGLARGESIQRPNGAPLPPAPAWDDHPPQSVAIALDEPAALQAYAETAFR